jgi:hypothetical protein
MQSSPSLIIPAIRSFSFGRRLPSACASLGTPRSVLHIPAVARVRHVDARKSTRLCEIILVAGVFVGTVSFLSVRSRLVYAGALRRHAAGFCRCARARIRGHGKQLFDDAGLL